VLLYSLFIHSMLLLYIANAIDFVFDISYLITSVFRARRRYRFSRRRGRREPRPYSISWTVDLTLESFCESYRAPNTPARHRPRILLQRTFRYVPGHRSAIRDSQNLAGIPLPPAALYLQPPFPPPHPLSAHPAATLQPAPLRRAMVRGVIHCSILFVYPALQHAGCTRRGARPSQRRSASAFLPFRCGSSTTAG
jgi:hypothetical protein